MKNTHKSKPGFYLPFILGFAAVSLVIFGAILSLVYNSYATVKHQNNSLSALNVSEAGINYYLWHLAHNNTDYCDGNTCSGNGPFGPYTHSYKDSAGNVIGSFDLTITPPVASGGGVTVRSDGQITNGDKRTIVATLGVPSYAKYSFISNSEVWFGSSDSTYGPVHSNKGIHFDGTAGDVVSSAVSSYTPSTCYGGDGTTSKSGVWGNGGPTSYWQYPVPQVDFNQITNSLSTLKSAAQFNGIYLPTLKNGSGNKSYSGYAIRLNADGTMTVGQVTGALDSGGLTSSCQQHGSYESLMQNVVWENTNRALPPNGVLYVEDNAWIWGTVTSRLTIASGRLPENSGTYTNVFLQNSINYSVKDGSVALGVISQSDIIINSDSDDTLNLDGYYLSQRGKVFRPYYANNTKTKLSLYGGIGSNSWWTWNWFNNSNQVISGYQTVNISYDSHLALSPPPSFPTTGSFAILNWREDPIL